jgi:DNA-binding HxlR family transcriptional regulator
MAEEIYRLAVDVTLKTISGKWKTSILCNLGTSPMRTGELKRHLRGISQRILTKQLTELEEDNIIRKKVYPEVPPRVEYCLTDNGRTLRHILLEMSKWGEQQAKLQEETGKTVKILDGSLKGFDDMNKQE